MVLGKTPVRPWRCTEFTLIFGYTEAFPEEINVQYDNFVGVYFFLLGGVLEYTRGGNWNTIFVTSHMVFRENRTKAQ